MLKGNDVSFSFILADSGSRLNLFPTYDCTNSKAIDIRLLALLTNYFKKYNFDRLIILWYGERENNLIFFLFWFKFACEKSINFPRESKFFNFSIQQQQILTKQILLRVRSITNYISFPPQIAYKVIEAGRSEDTLQVQGIPRKRDCCIIRFAALACLIAAFFFTISQLTFDI